MNLPPITPQSTTPQSITPPPITLLYAPADRPELVRKALDSRADAVIIDLEDAVAPGRKGEARENVRGLLSAVAPERSVQLRINAADSPWFQADLELVSDLPSQVEVRLPKVDDPTFVRQMGDVTSRRLHLLIESPVGVEIAFELACAAEQVASLGLGEADLKSALQLEDESGLTWIRSRIVLAARAAGLPAPVMSAYTNTLDTAGLLESSRLGRQLGFLGRTAIHPRQLEVIAEAFRPSAQQVERAQQVLDRLEDALDIGTGAIALADGTFLDVAMVEQARATVSLAERYRD